MFIPQIDLGEPLGLVPSYYYFLKEPSGKVLNFLKKNSEPLVKVNVFFLKIWGISGIRV
jgi:hypothetical protein